MPALPIGVGLSAVKTSFDLIKGLRELLTKPEVSPGEVLARLQEIQALLIDAQKCLADAEEENRTLRRALEDQNSLKDLIEDMEFQHDGGFYVRKSEAVAGLIAYCPLCWQKERLTVPLETPGTAGSFWYSIHATGYRTTACRDEIRKTAETRSGSRASFRAFLNQSESE